MLFRNAYWGLSTWCGHSMKILGFGKEARNVPLSGAGMGFPKVVPRISFEGISQLREGWRGRKHDGTCLSGGRSG